MGYFANYVMDDAVTHLGSSYIAIEGNTSQSPPNAAFWEVLAMKGATGAAGPQGPRGLPALNGLNGATGPQGPVGPQGPAGSNGLNGAAGTTGLQGPKGDQGDAGIQGIQGIQGAPGTDGPDGADGTNGSPDTAEQVRSKFFSATCEGNDSTDIMVRVGPLCVDKYEAVVVNSVGTKVGQTPDDYPCNNNGNDCSDTTLTTNIFARSEADVIPSRFITWFQAQQACANSGKRLPTNAEWQMAAAGTDDSGTNDATAICNIFGIGPVNTGSKTNCTSNWGANDMVGNLREWVADWVPAATTCTGGSLFGGDLMCIGDSSGGARPNKAGALLRGGLWGDGASAGVFALVAVHGPSFGHSSIGFRCAR